MKNFFLILTFITLFIIVIFSLLDIIDITQYINFTKNYDWLGFYGALLGSVIGGAITFIGVYITIKKQKETEDEKNRLSLIPILEYKISYNKRDFCNSRGQLAGQIISHINVEDATCNDEKSEEWYFNLIMNNVGIGHAQIISIKFIFKENGKEKIIHSYKERYCYKLVKVNDIKNFMFLIYAPKEHFFKKGVPIQDFVYTLDILVTYQDLLGNKYQQIIKASISKAVLYDNEKVLHDWNTAHLHFYDSFVQINENLD